MKPTKEALKELEQQLRCPSGTRGKELAENMHASNFSMTAPSIDLLQLQANDTVLELGHGNCGHINYLLAKAPSLSYIGLEISETMKSEAQKQKIEEDYTSVSFQLYDGKSLVFPELSMDKIFTVNTLYFWENPEQLINEIARVLKKEGVFIITVADKEFMKTLPFVKEKFKLYNTNDIELLVKDSMLTVDNFIHKTETVQSKTGEFVERKFTIAILKRKPWTKQLD